MSEEQNKPEENKNEGIDIPTTPSLRERIIATLKTLEVVAKACCKPRLGNFFFISAL